MHSEAKALECWIHYVDNVSIALFDKACLLFSELHSSHVIINYSRTQLILKFLRKMENGAS